MSPAPDAPLTGWLAWLEQQHPREIDLGLERVGKVAKQLGLDTPRAISLTVAGTNGKGSSANLAARIYQQAGYSVGLYTSPHLLRYNERIQVGGKEISDREICAAFAKIDAVRAGTPLTYFEFGTLAALLIFAAHAVDVQVLEVGLGGRLDAVNLVDSDAALISSIGIDHVDWLGCDRESIGAEKACVYRSAKPAICADPAPPASVPAHATKIGADYLALGDRYSISSADGSGWEWHCADERLSDLPDLTPVSPAMRRNMAGVLTAVHSLQAKLPVAKSAIRNALTNFSVAGRFQRCGRLILDVAHNPQAAEVLREQLLKLKSGAGKFDFVIGMLDGKDVQGFCEVLAPCVRRAYCASLDGPRGLQAPVLLGVMQSLGIQSQSHDTVTAAISAALTHTSDGEVVVTGSFLTVAAGMQYG